MSEQRVDLPDGLSVVVERMLAKGPEARFATAADVAAGLAPFASGSNLPALYAAAAARTSTGTVQTGALPTVPSAAPIDAPAASQITDTDAYLSSAFNGTDGGVGGVAAAESVDSALGGVEPATDSTLSTRTAIEGAADTIPPRRRMLVAAAGAAAVLLLGIVIVVKMRDGSTKRFEVKGPVERASQSIPATTATQ